MTFEHRRTKCLRNGSKNGAAKHHRKIFAKHFSTKKSVQLPVNCLDQIWFTPLTPFRVRAYPGLCVRPRCSKKCRLRVSVCAFFVAISIDLVNFLIAVSDWRLHADVYFESGPPKRNHRLRSEKTQVSRIEQLAHGTQRLP